MIGIFSLILILVISILITKIAAIALTHTGLSRESAKFQARSAFTGVGFTTSESEKVVNHPLRRKILLILMILGNAGIVTGIASLLTSFTGIESRTDNFMKILILIAGIVVLWHLANSKWVDRHLSNLINRILSKYTRIDVNDYASLLHLSGEYRISEMHIPNDHWMRGKQIKDTSLRDEGIIILAITREDGEFIGVPQANTQILENDSLILYGRGSTLNELENRAKGVRGKIKHYKQVQKQKKEIKDAKQTDPGVS